MTDLQVLIFYALEDMTLKELNACYFDGGGILYLKRLIVGEARPMEFAVKSFQARFDDKYQEKLKKYREVEKSSSQGW